MEGNECSFSLSGFGSFDNDCAVFSGTYTEFVSESSSQLSGNPEEAEEGVIEDDTLGGKVMDAIVCAIFEALDLLHEGKGSLKNFEELLTMARHMFCKGAGLGEDDETVKKRWPCNWSAVRQILIKEGYDDAKGYFICLSDAHRQYWDILESQ